MGAGPHEQGRVRREGSGPSGGRNEQSGLSREDGEQHPDWLGHDFWEGLVFVNHANLSLVKPHVNI